MSKKERVKGKGADIFFSKEQSAEGLAAEGVEVSSHRGDVTATEAKEQQSDLSARSEAKEQQSDLSARAQAGELATKATFYFTQSQLDALEKAVFLLSQEHRIKTNKSEVMRIACEEMVNDFLENRKDSALYQRLAG